MTPDGLLGRAMRRIDVADKLAGETCYSADLRLPAGTVHGAFVRSPHAAARLRGVDTQAALRAPGVVAVLTARDVPQNRFWISAVGDQGSYPHYVLAEESVRFVGEPVALVVAETASAAVAAAERVGVDYEPLAGIFDPEAARAPGARPVHEGHPNQLQHFTVRRGDVEGAFAQAQVVVEAEYRTQCVDACYLEPPAGVAWFDEDGVLTVRMGTQVPDHARRIAAVLGLPQHKVRLICPYLGGGFGGKEDLTIELHLALMAWATGRPASLSLTRQELLAGGTTKRHPFRLRYRTAADRDGRVTAQQVEIVADSGAYAYLSPRVVFNGLLHACGPYEVEAVAIDGYAVSTNNPPTGAMRGFGAMQVTLGHEGQMDRLAAALGLSPVEVRRRNLMRKGSRHPTGQVQETAVLLGEMLDRVAAEVGRDAYRTSGPTWRLGVGVACCMKNYGLLKVNERDLSQVWVGLQGDGSLVVRAGVADCGSGQVSTVAQIAAHVLGVPYGEVTVYHGDTALNPRTGMTASSRMTMMAGNAARVAAEDVRARLLPVAAEMLEANEADLVLAGGEVRLRGVPGRAVPIAAAVAQCGRRGIPVEALGSFAGPEIVPFDYACGQGEPAADFAFAVHGAVVEVDAETGQVRLLDYVAAHDVGRALDPGSIEGQIQGGAVQAIGQALMEDCSVQDGQVSAGALYCYLAPFASDVCDVRPIVFESGEGVGPFGARGVGEIPLSGPLGALAGAVADAVGARVDRLPITPERVLDALRDR